MTIDILVPVMVSIGLILLARVQGGILGWIFVTLIVLHVLFGNAFVNFIQELYYADIDEKTRLLQQQCGNDPGCSTASAFAFHGFGPGIEPLIRNIMLTIHCFVFMLLCISIWHQHRKARKERLTTQSR
jgi:hypothetical protein